ncbi:hypothetical protein BJX96DRAFT_153990 [Aspergillus floccosus]
MSDLFPPGGMILAHLMQMAFCTINSLLKHYRGAIFEKAALVSRNAHKYSVLSPYDSLNQV